MSEVAERAISDLWRGVGLLPYSCEPSGQNPEIKEARRGLTETNTAPEKIRKQVTNDQMYKG